MGTRARLAAAAASWAAGAVLIASQLFREEPWQAGILLGVVLCAGGLVAASDARADGRKVRNAEISAKPERP